MHAALRRHPWALSMLEGRRTPGPEALGGHEACLHVLRSAAFSLQATAHAYAILDAFVYGSPQEAMLDQVDLDDITADLIEGIDLSGVPYMADFPTEHVLTEDYSFGSSFEVGLGLTLDSLERLRAIYD